MAAVDQEEIDAINNLKTAHELISSSLENDLLILQNKHKALSTDFDEQKTQLVEALLSKDRLMKDLAATKDRSGNTDGDQAQARAIIEAEEKQKEVSSIAASVVSTSTSKKLLNRFSRLFSAPKNNEVEPSHSLTLDLGPSSTPAADHNLAFTTHCTRPEPRNRCRAYSRAFCIRCPT